MTPKTYNQLKELLDVVLIAIIVVIISFGLSVLFSKRTKPQGQIDEEQTAEIISYHQQQDREIIVFE